MARQVVAILLLASIGGCGKAPARPTSVGHGVVGAALPFVIYDREGRRVEEPAMLDALAGARAVCVGEAHSNPHDHWMQLHLLDALSARASVDGAPMALGLEMVQAGFQSVLDDYAIGKIDDRVMLARSEWRRHWSFDFGLYRPMIQMAVTRGLGLLALNQRRDVVKRVGREGVDALSVEERAELPEMVLDDEEHRAWFDAAMEEHPGLEETGGGDDEVEGGEGGEGGEGEDAVSGADVALGDGDGDGNGNGNGDGDGEGDGEGDGGLTRQDFIYQAQVLWDETMADNAAKWLAEDERRRVVIFAGTGHCHDSAIARRLERRGFAPALTVHPVVDDGQGSADDALRAQNNDYVVVMIAGE